MSRTCFLLVPVKGGASVKVGRRKAVVGRSPECDVVISDPSVSRRHAEIRREKSALLVADLASRHGTFIDGEKIARGEVAAGQTLCFGSAAFALRTAGVGEPEMKTADELPAFPDVKEISRRLTEAQRRVLDLLMEGCTEKDIARRLGVSANTAHTHIAAIYRVLGVHSRSELLVEFTSPQTGRA